MAPLLHRAAIIKQETISWQWHQLDHMQIVCTLLQTDNQGSHKPGKPGIVGEFCKPGKVREFQMWSGNFL